MEIMTDNTISATQLYREKREPVLLKGRIKEWAAIEKWTWEYLKELAQDRTVKLVSGNREIGKTCFVHMQLAEYIDIVANPDTQQKTEKLYLKEFDLLTEFPELNQDTHYDTFFPKNMTVGNNAWIGVQGATTGLHYDFFHNLFTQVRGNKKFLLLPKEKVERSDYSDKFDSYARLSTLDLFDENIAVKLEPIVVDVEPGDSLFIPKGWWHQVKSVDPCISVSGFMVSSWEAYTIGMWEAGLKFVHDKGLYKKGNCTCHAQ